MNMGEVMGLNTKVQNKVGEGSTCMEIFHEVSHKIMDENEVQWPSDVGNKKRGT
jgi:hypothetical protein